MRPASSERGYAFLAALVVTALAAVFAATALAAVSARQSIVGADGASVRAQAAARQALARVCLELKRHPAALEGELSSPATIAADEAWQATWVKVDAGAGMTWPVVMVSAEATCDGARKRLSASVELRSEAVPQGLAVGGDVELHAPLTVAGSGLYCGGCLRGREWLELGGLDPAGGATPPADGVHADIWPRVGVHALGGVWSAGEEIHAGLGAGGEYPDDTDMHTGDSAVSPLVATPGVALLVTLRDNAVAPGVALHDGTLDLARLPLSCPPRPGTVPADGGYVVVASAGEGAELRLTGARQSGACPIVLVVEGDVAIGEEGIQTGFHGAFLVSGSLRVCGPSSLRGHLFAGDLLVSAPLSVELASDWRERPLSGLASPVVVALDGL